MTHILQAPGRFAGITGTFMGRDALALAAMHLHLKPEDRVIVPAYACQEVVKPFLGKASVVFHDIDADLTVLPEEILRLFREHKPKAFVLINYFGFLQPHRNDLKRTCAEHGVTLIEDCAHSLLTEGSGETGEICIFSFRKHLPLSDGGGIKLNKNGQSLPAVFHARIFSNVLSLLSRAKSLLNVRSSKLSRSGIQGQSRASHSSKAAVGKVLPMSTFVARRIRRVDVAEVVERCRADYLMWQREIADCASMSPLFSELPPGVCPLGFPVRSGERERIVTTLERAGVPIKRYWRLSSAVGAEYTTSNKLAREVFALPVFPELTASYRSAVRTVLQAEARQSQYVTHA